MVYCGKPSPACYLCRTRRIKCDRIHPECTQCANKSIKCPGYRSPLDQYFRDESDKVRKKAEASYQAVPRNCKIVRSRKAEMGFSSRFPSCTSGTKSSYASHTDWSEDIPVFMMWSNALQSFEDAALTYFMSFYIPGSHFEYLPTLYSRTCIGSPLSSTVQAASLATLSIHLGEPSLMIKARNAYARGLTATGSVLENAITATKDSTLTSVLLLCLFEAIVCTNLDTLDNWTTHTNGALALVRLRGKEQFETEQGRRLFRQVGNIVRITCIQQRARLPQDFSNLQSTAELFYEPNYPSFALANLIAELTDFLADLREGVLRPLDVVRRAMQQDQKYVQLMLDLPDSWKYTQVFVKSYRQDVYENIIHRYPNHHVAQLWNSCRMIRILLNEISYTHATPIGDQDVSLHSSKILLQQYAVRNIEQAAVGICASIPQFSRSSNTKTPDESPTRAYAASVLWPLTAVRSASLAPERARLYCIDRLRYLGRELEIPQAERIASHNTDLEALKDGLHMFYAM